MTEQPDQNLRMGNVQETMLAQVEVANGLTLSRLIIDVMSMTASMQQQFEVAIALLIVTGLMDGLDGWVARRCPRTALQAEVGRNLDSLVDLCSFGVSPVVFAYALGLQDWVSIVIMAVYLSCGALRLAVFNASEQASASHFTGLPITAAAFIIPIAYSGWLVLPPIFALNTLKVTYLAIAMLMISNLRFPKIRGISLLFSLFALLIQ